MATFSANLKAKLIAKTVFYSTINVTRRTFCHKREALVHTEIVGRVCLIGINRPEHRNLINAAVASALVDSIGKFEGDANLYVGVIHGKGGNFCAGVDEEEVKQIGDEFLAALRGITFSKPVLASISGYAVAAGLELALRCDFRVFDESAICGTTSKYGLPLVDGGATVLPRLIGGSQAFDLILTGRPIAAKEALQFGLANRVVPIGAALGEAVKLAQSISGHDQSAMLRDRRTARTAVYGDS